MTREELRAIVAGQIYAAMIGCPTPSPLWGDAWTDYAVNSAQMVIEANNRYTAKLAELDRTAKPENPRYVSPEWLDGGFTALDSEGVPAGEVHFNAILALAREER